jgi:hypothetical protein
VKREAFAWADYLLIIQIVGEAFVTVSHVCSYRSLQIRKTGSGGYSGQNSLAS